MTNEFIIPSKIGVFLKRLCIAYDGLDIKLRNLVFNSSVFVREATEHDDWNGGIVGHDVVVFTGKEHLKAFSLKQQEAARDRLLNDLRTLSSGISSEFISAVSIELGEEVDPEFQRASPVAGEKDATSASESLWHYDFVRLFISHRDSYKGKAHELAQSLNDYGISSFVAHDTIEPMSTWQNEILKALASMEVMLCFVTNDFHESIWVNQEVGYALGSKTPVISLKLESRDPAGFIGSKQALKGNLESPTDAASDVFRLISEKVGYGERMRKALVEAFVQSTSFDDAKRKFDRLESASDQLSATEVATIQKGFKENSQLNCCFYLKRNNRLSNYLSRAAGKGYQVRRNELVEVDDSFDDEIPF